MCDKVISGPPSTCIRHPLAPSRPMSINGDLRASSTMALMLSKGPEATMSVALPLCFTTVFKSIKSRFILPSLPIVEISPSTSSSTQPDPCCQSILLLRDCHANLSSETRMQTSTASSRLGRASLAILDLKDCSAKGSPATTTTIAPFLLAERASSKVEPVPVPPPSPVRMITNSAESSTSAISGMAVMVLWAANAGSAAVPFSMPVGSKCIQCA